MQRFIIGVVASLSLVVTAAFSQTSGSVPIDAPWNLKPIVRVGDKTEHGATILELWDGYWLESGHLVVWARIGAKDTDWVLVSVQADTGVLRPVFDWTPGKAFTLTNWKAFFRLRRAALYWNEAGSFYAWDGSTRRQMMGKGMRLDDQGSALPVASAEILIQGVDDSLLFRFRTSETKPRNGLGVFHNEAFHVLAFEGDRLTEGTGRIKAFRFPPDGMPPCTAGGAGFVEVDVENERYKRGFVRLTDSRREKLLAVGEPTPVMPSHDVKRVYACAAAAPDIFSVSVIETPHQPLLLYSRGGETFRLFGRTIPRDVGKAPDAPREQFPMWQTVGSGQFVRSGEPDFVWMGGYDEFVTANPLRPRERVRRVELYHFDGVRTRVATDRAHVGKVGGVAQLALGRSISDPNTLSITPLSSEGFTFSVMGRQLTLFVSKQGSASTAIASSTGGTEDVGRSLLGRSGEFVEAPRIPAEGSERLTYLSVLAWRSSGEAIVKRSDGFYAASAREPGK